MITLPEMRMDWNPEAVYDITGINGACKWEYYFSKLFPEHEFTIYIVGGLKNGEKRMLFMQRTDERFKTFLLYRDVFTFKYMDGKVEMFIANSFSSDSKAEIEEKFLAGKDWLAAVYGQPDEKGEVIVNFVPKTFEELDLVIAREFTQEEMIAIDNAELQKRIDQKMREAEELRAKIKV